MKLLPVCTLEEACAAIGSIWVRLQLCVIARQSRGGKAEDENGGETGVLHIDLDLEVSGMIKRVTGNGNCSLKPVRKWTSVKVGMDFSLFSTGQKMELRPLEMRADVLTLFRLVAKIGRQRSFKCNFD